MGVGYQLLKFQFSAKKNVLKKNTVIQQAVRIQATLKMGTAENAPTTDVLLYRTKFKEKSTCFPKT